MPFMVWAQKHSVRLGWGDMLFETAAFHEDVADFSFAHRYGFGYTGHIFTEYQYRWKKNVRLGAMLDCEGIFWTEDGKGRVRNYNLVAMPTIRFDYFNHETVSLYSGLGAGLLTAFDNIGGFGISPAWNLNLLGIEIGRGPWSGAAELGFMTAVADSHRLYMLGSKLISVSINYRW